MVGGAGNVGVLAGMTGFASGVDRQHGTAIYSCFCVFSMAVPSRRARPDRGVVDGDGLFLRMIGAGVVVVGRHRSCLSDLCVPVGGVRDPFYSCFCRMGCESVAPVCLCGSFGGGLAGAGRGLHPEFVGDDRGLASRKASDAACSRVNRPWVRWWCSEA